MEIKEAIYVHVSDTLRGWQTWHRGLQSDLGTIGMSWAEAKKRAKNRTIW